MPPKQTKIPGTDSDRHKDLDAQAARYVEARDMRMSCTEAEVDEKQKLHEMMKKHGITEYKVIDCDPQLLVTIEVTEETLRVKKLVEAKSGVVDVKVEG